MSQNIYDDNDFFAGYAQLPRSQHGLQGAPEWQAIAAQLPDLQQACVVDLGCGYGWFSRYAASQGARHVLGLDLSVKMLEQARAMTDDPCIDYQRADMADLTLATAQYDVIYSSLALHYIENLTPLMATLFAALKPGGTLLFTAEHPIFMAASAPDWVTAGDGQRSWPVNHYQQEGQRITHWFAEGVVKYHRTLGTWVNTLIAAGFWIQHLEEWGPSAEQIAAHPALAEEQMRPMMFILRASRP
ncbi:SAM-dependent methyltransferase [Enterobacterales bacterium CwR94]|nr:SAM-dependent methyltransferase [Enterobacterales bacterium CwR94]